MALQFLRRKKSPQKARLGARRKKVFTIKSVVTLITFLVFASIFIWAVRLPQITVSTVHVDGNSIVSGDAVRRIVFKELAGTYALLIPKANSFVLPYRNISREVKDSFLRIKDVVITKNNLATIIVTVTERQPFALWCGETYIDTEEVLGTCYFLDEDGYVFAKSPDFSGSIFLKYFGFLEDGNGQGGLDPIGKYFAGNGLFLNVKGFLEALRGSGVVPVSLTQSGFDIEITLEDYSVILFGDDQDVTVLFDNYQSIQESEVFIEAWKNGTEIDYIDFRFGNKVFYKFK